MQEQEAVRPPEQVHLRSGFYFKDGDADILKRLVQYRYLQPLDFQKLTLRNIISLRRRLREFVSRGYLERLTLPLERDAPVGSPPDGFVYQLAGEQRRSVLLDWAEGTRGRLSVNMDPASSVGTRYLQAGTFARIFLQV